MAAAASVAGEALQAAPAHIRNTSNHLIFIISSLNSEIFLSLTIDSSFPSMD